MLLLFKNPTVSSAYVATATDFDGTNDYMTRGADLTGMADGRKGTLSFWVRFDGGDAALQNILFNTTGAAGFGIRKHTTNVMRTFLRNAAGTSVFDFDTTNTYTAGATWRHFLYSWDTDFSAGNKIAHCYVTDAVETLVKTDASAAFDIDYTMTGWAVGANSAGSAKLNGCLSELWFNPTYLDITVEANRRKFISATGKPVSLGADGSTPTGLRPILYLKNASATFQNNLGSGGNFTVTGALDACSSSPSD